MIYVDKHGKQYPANAVQIVEAVLRKLQGDSPARETVSGISDNLQNFIVGRFRRAFGARVSMEDLLEIMENYFDCKGARNSFAHPRGQSENFLRNPVLLNEYVGKVDESDAKLIEEVNKAAQVYSKLGLNTVWIPRW